MKHCWHSFKEFLMMSNLQNFVRLTLKHPVFKQHSHHEGTVMCPARENHPPKFFSILNTVTPVGQGGTRRFEFSIKVSLHPLNWRRRRFIDTRQLITCLECEFYFITVSWEHKRENIGLISGFTQNLDFLIKANFILFPSSCPRNPPFEMAKQIIKHCRSNVFVLGIWLACWSEASLYYLFFASQ